MTNTFRLIVLKITKLMNNCAAPMTNLFLTAVSVGHTF